MITLKSGEEVFFNANISEEPEFSSALCQALSHVESGDRESIEEEVDLGRIIGQVDGVSYTSLVVKLEKSNKTEDAYVLNEAFIGKLN